MQLKKMFAHPVIAKGFKIVLLANLILTTNLLAQEYPFSTGAQLLTPEQFAQLPKINVDSLLRNHSNNLQGVSRTAGSTMLPTPPIGDQLHEGSCIGWAFGYAALSIMIYEKDYSCWGGAERSPNYIYNQIKISSDCNSGSHATDALNLLKAQGDCSKSEMPYVDYDCTTSPNSYQVNNAARFKILAWGSIYPNNVTAMKQLLDGGYPIPITFKVTNDGFMSGWNSPGGIWTNIGSVEPRGHAACIVGYDDMKISGALTGMFKVQNQWGTVNGGDAGFFWIPYSLVTTNCLSEAYIILAVPPLPTGVCSGLSGVSAGCGGYFLHFTPISGISGYEVEYLDLTTGADNTTNIGYSATDYCSSPNWLNVITPGHSFEYRLGIPNVCGSTTNWSSWSAPIYPTLISCTSIPTGLVVSSPCGYAGSACGYGNFTWTAIAGAPAYQVTYTIFNPSTGITEPPVTFSTTSNSVTYATGMFSGTGWNINFQVKAECSSGAWSAYSPISSTFGW